MKIVLLIFIFFTNFSLEAKAPVKLVCGHYKLGGVLRKLTNTPGIYLAINEKTYSEYQIKIETSEEYKMFPYFGKFISFEGYLRKKDDNYRSVVSDIDNIKRVPYDPFGFRSDLGISLLEEKGCQ